METDIRDSYLFICRPGTSSPVKIAIGHLNLAGSLQVCSELLASVGLVDYSLDIIDHGIRYIIVSTV